LSDDFGRRGQAASRRLILALAALFLSMSTVHVLLVHIHSLLIAPGRSTAVRGTSQSGFINNLALYAGLVSYTITVYVEAVGIISGTARLAVLTEAMANTSILPSLLHHSPLLLPPGPQYLTFTAPRDFNLSPLQIFITTNPATLTLPPY